jgi:hypothetical protein
VFSTKINESVEILSRDVFISLFLMEECGRVRRSEFKDTLCTKILAQINLCVFLNKRIKEMYGGMDVERHTFVTSTIRGQMVCFTYRPLYPREGVSSADCLGGWEGSRDGIDAVVKRKLSAPDRNQTPSPRS